MPSPTKQAAVAAINVADPGALLTIAQFTYLIESSYNTHIRKAEDLERKGARLKHRLYRARALECAAILVDYYRRRGMNSAVMFWEKRRRLCEALAYNHKNTIARNIGAGSDDATEVDPTEPDS